MDPNDYPSVTTVEKWTHNDRTRKINWVQLSPQLGHWTGYATTALTETYPILEAKVQVNGGLTYGVDDGGFVGFDCGHAWDACERDGELYGVFRDREDVTVWTREKVREEVESLVEQLEQLEAQAETDGRPAVPYADMRDMEDE